MLSSSLTISGVHERWKYKVSWFHLHHKTSVFLKPANSGALYCPFSIILGNISINTILGCLGLYPSAQENLHAPKYFCYLLNFVRQDCILFLIIFCAIKCFIKIHISFWSLRGGKGWLVGKRKKWLETHTTSFELTFLGVLSASSAHTIEANKHTNVNILIIPHLTELQQTMCTLRCCASIGIPRNMARCPTLQALLPTVQKVSSCNFLDVAELNKDTEAFKEWVIKQMASYEGVKLSTLLAAN